MLVHRFTWLAKRGRRNELRRLASEGIKELRPPHATRTLVTRYAGSEDVLIHEFEDTNELHEFWTTRDLGPFLEKVNPLTEHLSRELFEIVD